MTVKKQLLVVKIDRRSFLRVTGITTTGLVLGAVVGCDTDKKLSIRPPARPGVFAPNTYIQIDANGIFVYAPNPEVGQGVKTALPMIVAEELDVPWEHITVVQAGTNKAWYGRQMAALSKSIRESWDPLRHAGALARTMLIDAAASKWGITPEECKTNNARVVRSSTGESLSYLELAGDASNLSLPDPELVVLKKPTEFALLGRRITDVDATLIATGETLFAIDHQLPDMVHATYVRCPASGGEVSSANIDVIKALPGVHDAFIVEGNGKADELLSGVAIVAVDTWISFKARRAVEIIWNESGAAKDSSTATRQRALDLARTEGEKVIVDNGDVDAALAKASTRISAIYEYGSVSHAQMEPQNTTAWWHNGVMELWAPTPNPHRALGAVARALSIPKDKIIIHQLRAGGGFGRGHRPGVVVEAAAIAQRVGRPVKHTWTREDDMTHDFYRASGFHSLTGALDGEGSISAWRNHHVSLTENGKKPVSGGRIDKAVDPAPFVDNYKVTQSLLPWRTPCGPWRAPDSNVVAFAHQCFLHELAVAAGRDHLEFLLSLMGEPRWLKEGNPMSLHTGRARGVLRLVAEKAGWGGPLAQGHALGLAFYFSHASHIAEVAEVSVDNGKRLRVHRVTVAADAGPIINLSGAENQVQGSVIDGLSAMLGQEITFENGRAQQANFDEYPLLRITRAPKVDVNFLESEYPPSGLGEPAFPPLAPAVANAIYAATGERVRRLPISREGWV